MPAHVTLGAAFITPEGCGDRLLDVGRLSPPTPPTWQARK